MVSMRRSRLFTVFAGTLMAAFLLPAVALASEPPTPTPLPTFALHCALVIPAGHPNRERVACHWAAASGVQVRAYRLWRVVDPGLGRGRHLVARVTPDQPLRAVDHNILPGHRYSYRVVAIGTDGKRVALSNVESIRVGRPAQKLAMACAYLIGDARQGVTCHWSASVRRGAVRYVVTRAVNGGAREIIHRSGIHARRGLFDTDVAAGQTIRYRVFALTANGRVVGIGADSIVVPTIVTPLAS
jgi:hypothetical protein